MASPQELDCLICGNHSPTPTTSLTGSQLRKLWASLDNEIGESAYGSISPETIVYLYKCSSCGFRFYDPKFTGSAEFYEELMAKKIYPLGSPEFTHTIDFALKNGITRVLDVGGGEGAFLDLAKKSGLRTSGVELNRNASEVAAAKGHQMFNKQMEDISLEELEGGAELLTLFQVVEHVSSPLDFVISASRLVKPGGFISIAVPSDRRALCLLENDPADWPPHHVSRWRVQDLQELGNRAGLELVAHSTDAFYGGAIGWAIDLHNKFEVALGRKPMTIPPLVISATSFTYRALKLQKLLPFHGLSVCAVLRKSPV